MSAATPDPNAYKLYVHKHDGELIGLIVPFAVLTILSVVLRFVARAKTKVGLGGDDWLCLAAFAGWLGYLAMELYGLGLGFYKVPFVLLPVPSLITYLQDAYVTAIMSVFSLTLSKLSILWLYWRLFPTRNFRRGVYAVTALTLGYGISSQLVTIFRCRPIKAAWDIRVQGDCIDFTLFFLISEPFAMLADFLIVILPINVVRKLKLPLKRKIQLCLVFAVGLFVTVISAIRLAITTSSAEKLASSASASWLYVQITVGIIAISMPTYGPLMSSLDLTGSRIKTWYHGLLTRQSHSSKSSNASSHGGQDTRPGSESRSMSKQQHMYVVEGDRANSSFDQPYPMQQISTAKADSMV